MAATKATLKRIPEVPVQRHRNKKILNRRIRNSSYSSQSKVAEVKQNRRVVRRMTMRRKSYYRSGKRECSISFNLKVF